MIDYHFWVEIKFSIYRIQNNIKIYITINFSFWLIFIFHSWKLFIYLYHFLTKRRNEPWYILVKCNSAMLAIVEVHLQLSISFCVGLYFSVFWVKYEQIHKRIYMKYISIVFWQQGMGTHSRYRWMNLGTISPRKFYSDILHVRT